MPTGYVGGVTGRFAAGSSCRNRPDRVERPMTQQHPDLAAEQEFIEHAYRCLEISRDAAWRMRNLHEGTLGGTFQARYERDVFDEAVVNRLTQLDLGNAALVFGRIDRMAETPDGLETFHIGRLAIADEESEPVVVDWRAPVAEPFYRATGREPMGLARRRHFAVQGRTLLGLEDELFGDGHLGVGHDDGLLTASTADRHGPTTAARLQHPARRARARPHRPARRHRRHDPGRAGRDHPQPASRRAGRAGRPGHGQDRRCAAPRRLPALHLPLPARGPGRAGHRPQPGVPALHRAGAAVARRGRHRAGRARRPRARRRLGALRRRSGPTRR